MSIGIWQLVLILVIVFVIFGAGKLPRVMGDMGKGVRAMRDGLKGNESDTAAASKELPKQSADTIIEHDTDTHDKKSS